MATQDALKGRVVLVTGGARRVGRIFTLACARAGADVVIHHGHSDQEAGATRQEVLALGRKAWVVQADLGDPAEVQELMRVVNESTPVHALVNSAAIFQPLSLETTSLEDWQKHLQINLTAPFLLSQAFAKQAGDGARIVNILDWRALRPGRDHLPYTISKAALAALTQSLAVALAPRVTVNGLALGAILPPSDGEASPDILKRVPAGRWAEEQEVAEALVFALSSPTYITGEIIHLDGGRHLV